MKNLETNWLQQSKTYAKCPRCKRGDLANRIPRGYIVKHLLFFIDLKRYRCNNCSAKFYLKNS